MVVSNMRSPSIPLTQSDLRAIAGVRLSKQFNKRLILVLVPTVVMAIAGVAFHRTGVDVGFMLTALAMAGFLASMIVMARWSERATTEFATKHAGSFWLKSVQVIEEEKEAKKQVQPDEFLS